MLYSVYSSLGLENTFYRSNLSVTTNFINVELVSSFMGSEPRTGLSYALKLRGLLTQHGVSVNETARGGFDVPHKAVSERAGRVVTGSVYVDKRGGNTVRVNLAVHPVIYQAGTLTRQIGRAAIASFDYSGSVDGAPAMDEISGRLGLENLDLPAMLPSSATSGPRHGSALF